MFVEFNYLKQSCDIKGPEVKHIYTQTRLVQDYKPLTVDNPAGEVKHKPAALQHKFRPVTNQFTSMFVEFNYLKQS